MQLCARMRTGTTIRSALFLVVLVPLSGCDLDTAAVVPPEVSISAAPAFICADEEVAITWDAEEQTDSAACRPGLVGTGAGDLPSRDECILVDRSSSPSVSSWDLEGDLQSQGTVVVTVSQTTEFTARGTVASWEGRGVSFDESASTTVSVIEETDPPTPTSLAFTFEGGCDGALPSWTEVRLKDQLSGCLEVLQVCNSSTEIVELEDAEDSSRGDTLPGGGCTDVFNNARAPYLTGRVSGFVAPPGVCGATLDAGRPPSFGIVVAVQCNRDLESCLF